MKVLFIDDDEGLLEQAKLYFEEDEIDPVTVQSSADALKILREKNFDAIVCDYKMPEMDGLELLKNLRGDGYDVPFIMFTGKGREEVAMRALNLGADRYIQKGGDPKIQYSVLADAIKQEAEHWKTKKELTSAEKKYKDLSEKSLVGVYVIQDDLFRYVNPEFCRIFGYKRSELLGKKYRDLVADESLDRVERGVTERQNNEGSPTRYEFKALTKEKEKIDVEVFSVPSSYQGRPAVQGTLIDITESKRKEKKLKENKEKIEKLHEITNNMIELSEKEDVYNYTVEVAQDILDFDICSVDIVEDGMLRVKATSDKTPRDSSFDSPADSGVGGRTYQNNESILIEDVGEVSDADPKNSDFKSGISVPIGDLGVFQAVAYEKYYFDEEDLRMADLLSSHTAQTLEKIERENQIENKKDKITSLHNVVFELRDCDSVEDVYDKTVEVAKEILNFDVCGIVIDEGGKGIVRSASENVPDDGKKVTEISEGIIGKTFQEKDPLLIKNVEKVDVEPKLHDFKSGINVPILDEGVFQAISREENEFDEKDLEMAELLVAHTENAVKRIKSEDMKRFMVTLLRHDMKNKGRIVEGYLEILEDNVKTDDAMKMVKKAQKSSAEVLDFIDKIGMLKEIDQEKEFSRYPLDRALDSAISKMGNKLEDADIDVHKEYTELEVIGGHLLEEMFYNIIENSVKHTDCSHIWISIEEKDNYAVVEIEDDGEGIDEDILDKVFSKGIKGEGSSGTGIGLYLVNKIAELYGGKTEVDNMDEGGSRFIISLKKP